MDPLGSLRHTFPLSPSPWSVVSPCARFRLSGDDPDFCLTGFGIWVLLTVGWFLGFLVEVGFVSVGSFQFFCSYLVAVFSARALGAGFRPGVRPTVSTTLTKGWTGWRFFAALSYRCMLLFVPTASAFGLSDKRNII